MRNCRTYQALRRKLAAFAAHPPRNWTEYGQVCAILANALEIAVERVDGRTLPEAPWFQQGLRLLAVNPETAGRPETHNDDLAYDVATAVKHAAQFAILARALLNWAAHAEFGDCYDFGPGRYRRLIRNVFAQRDERQFNRCCLRFIFRLTYSSYGERRYRFSDDNLRQLLVGEMPRSFAEDARGREMATDVKAIKRAICLNGRPKGKKGDRLHVSQSAAAGLFGVSVATIAAWDHNRRMPPLGYSRLLRVDPNRADELRACADAYKKHRQNLKDCRRLTKERLLHPIHWEGEIEQKTGVKRDWMNANRDRLR